MMTSINHIDHSVSCPHCQRVFEGVNKDVLVDAYLNGDRMPCLCGQVFNLLDRLTDRLSFFNLDPFGTSLALVGATVTYCTFPLQEGVNAIDLTTGDSPLPPTARIVSLRLSAIGDETLTPLLLNHSEYLSRTLEPRLVIVGCSLWNRPRVAGQMQIVAVWHDLQDVSLKNLLDAAIDFRHGRNDSTILYAQIAFESAMTPLLVRADPQLNQGRFRHSFKNKMDNLRRLERKFGVPRMPPRLFGNLDELRSLRNDKGHRGIAHMERRKASELLASAYLGLKYAELFRSHLP